MFIRATCDFENSCFNVRKGQLVDMPDKLANVAIRDGQAVAVGAEQAIDEITSVAETATDSGEMKRGPGRPRGN